MSAVHQVSAEVTMDEDTVFTKRFIDCIKKAQSERNEQVRDGAGGVSRQSGTVPT